MIFYPIFLSVYGQLFYHVPVRIIMHYFYTFLRLFMQKWMGQGQPLAACERGAKGLVRRIKSWKRRRVLYKPRTNLPIQTKGIEALYEWCAASNTPHCFVFIFKIPITSSIVSATWRFPHSDGSMNPASSHAFICARRPS